MDSTFGVRLRLQRERQQIELSAIADSTKIKLSLLSELEHDDISHWPRGIFRRSYIRAYAQAIGLNPDTTVREFLQQHPDPEEDVQTALDQGQVPGSDSRRRPPTRLRFLLGSALSALPGLRANSGHSNGATGQHAPPVSEPALEFDDVPPVTFDAGPELEEPPLYDPPDPDPIEEIPAIESSIAPAREEAATSHQHCGVNFSALADLCTRLARALELEEVIPALRDAANELGAVGLIVWMPDTSGTGLTPALTHGYSDDILARLPCVPNNTDNAIAAAYRSVETRVVAGSESETGALVVPMSAPRRCAGVLALELRHGAEQDACVRAFATILAAQLSTLFEAPSLAQAVSA